MGKQMKKLNIEKSGAEFQAKIEALRAGKTQRVVEVRSDYAIPGFCKHGIPVQAHCPHGCSK